MIKKLLILLTIIGAVTLSCSDNSQKRHKTDTVSFDLDSIRARGKLIAVIDFNSTNYFVYKGEPMGFHFELLQSFSDHLGVDLEIISENDLEDAFEMLHTGKADLLAFGLTVTSSRQKEIQFTEPIDETRQVLIQSKPHNWRSLNSSALESKLLRNQSDLAGKTVFVQKSSSHAERLRALSEEIGGPITIAEVPYESEELIQLVESGDIEYAVCDENIAQVNATYYPDIDVSTPVSFTESLAWGIRKKDSDKLQTELDQWIKTFRHTQTYAMLYSKYFRNARSNSIVKSDYYSLNTGKISPWDDIIKTYSATINWDWRLVASLICEESRFIPNVKSRAGAYGLMQVMPETGKQFGIDITASPRYNIMAGAKYIGWLHSIFDPRIIDPEQRTRFILAAYNAGPGHILDAMKLAEKNGMDPQKWDDNVAVWLLKKCQPRFYNDTVVKNGFFKGKESVAFVNGVISRYEHYKNLIPDNNVPLSFLSPKN